MFASVTHEKFRGIELLCMKVCLNLAVSEEFWVTFFIMTGFKSSSDFIILIKQVNFENVFIKIRQMQMRKNE